MVAVRLGCGCLLLTLLIVACLGAATWGAVEMLRRPDDVPVLDGGRDDAVHAQQKIYAIVSAGGRRSTRHTVVLTEKELNAFLARNVVDIGDVPMSDLATRLVGPGVAEIWGRLPLAYLVADTPIASAVAMLPRSLHDRRLWIRLVTDVSVEVRPGARRYLRLDVTRCSIGRQRLPSVLPRLMFDPSALRWLRWSLPSAVEDVRIEKGQVVVRTAA